MTKLRKKDLNQNIKLGDGNTKLVGSEKTTFLTWGISAVVTCPNATPICKKICYARIEENFRPNIKASRARHYNESLKDSFIKDMVDILNYELDRKKNADKIIFVRIHTSGDFYSLEYFNKWAAIAAAFKGNKRIHFQAYTKEIDLLKNADLENINIKLIFSIMPDTAPQQIKTAHQLRLTTFEAKHKTMILETDKVCPGECGPCLNCYVGRTPQQLVVETHGQNKNKVL
jgi:hypothetical protein